MELSTEELNPIDGVTEDLLREILESEAFGKFAILASSETCFIQAANDWTPTDECSQFLQQHDSDPWILEYRDGATDTHFRATGHQTLKGVIDSFASYLQQGSEWRRNVEWQIVDL